MTRFLPVLGSAWLLLAGCGERVETRADDDSADLPPPPRRSGGTSTLSHADPP